MEKYIWLFPILFIVHDMEEVIGFGDWLKINESFLEKKFPFILKMYKNFSTEGMALAVLEELILCILICLAALFIPYRFTLYLWLGSFIACALHYVVHIIQVIIIRRYIPALITSVLCLPISICLIQHCIVEYQISIANVFIFSTVGLLLILCNLKFAHFLIGWYTQKRKH